MTTDAEYAKTLKLILDAVTSVKTKRVNQGKDTGPTDAARDALERAIYVLEREASRVIG